MYCFLSARVGMIVILLAPSTHSSGSGDLQTPDMLFRTLNSRQERQHVGGCLGPRLGSYFWELGSAPDNQPNLASLMGTEGSLPRLSWDLVRHTTSGPAIAVHKS